MAARALRQLAPQVPRSETTSQVDALAPGAEITDEGEEGSLTADGGFIVVVGVVGAAQNPITSRRRCSACSRPRRGSRRRSAYRRKRLTIHTLSALSAKARAASFRPWCK